MIELPKEISQPTFDFSKEKCILYAENGEGKTTLTAHLPDAIIVAVEKGASKVEAYKVDVNNWGEFLEAMELIKKSPKFLIAIIDSITCLYLMFLKYFKEKHGIRHEGDIPFKGFSMLAREFTDEFVALQGCGKGYWLITNTEREETKNGAGKIIPNIPESKGKIIWNETVGACDYVFYLNEEAGPSTADALPEPMKVLHTKATDDYFAKSRFAFPRPDIPLVNGDPEKSVKRIINAYHQAAKQYQEKNNKGAAQ